MFNHKVYPKSTDPVTFNSVYSMLQNANKVVLNCRLGPTLSCLVAEKGKFPNYNFSTTTTKPFNKVRMRVGEIKKIVWKKEQVII